MTDNKEVIFPNSNITVNNITNFSSQEKRRVDLVFGVAYDSDLKKVKNVIGDVISGNEKILKDPEPFVAVSELADSSVDFTVRVWCKTKDYWDVFFYMKETVFKSFGENGIVIPFKQIDVHNS